MLIPRERSVGVEVENLNEFFYIFLLLYSLDWYIYDRKLEVERMRFCVVKWPRCLDRFRISSANRQRLSVQVVADAAFRMFVDTMF